jgi:hypothetical protein
MGYAICRVQLSISNGNLYWEGTRNIMARLSIGVQFLIVHRLV